MNTSIPLFCVLFIFCFSADVAVTSSLKILAIFPYTGKSHHYVIDPILTELAVRGNEVTVLSRFPPKQEVQNRKDIVFGFNKTLGEHTIGLDMIEAIPEMIKFTKIIAEMTYLSANAKESCVELLTNTEVQDLLQSKKKFDVVLVEQFNTDCGLGLVYRFGAPAVGFTADTLMPWHFERFGALTNPSFVPCHNLGYGTRPNIIETAVSWTICTAVQWTYYFTITVPTQKITREYLGDDIPSFDILTRNISMVITNSYFPLNGAFPTSPNMVEAGGLHLTNPKEIPDDLQQFLDESTNGIIYFSFGSMAKMSTMPSEKLKALQMAFSELTQTVLWKWENDTMPNQPKNVVIMKWFPQFEILSHKNVKAFITHSGMLSTTEAVFAGVPIVAVPLFGDQFMNAQAAKESGLGTILHFHDITRETMSNALKEVLDPRFRENVKKLSNIWKDRPMTPIDTAIFWIEHVTKYGGEHLRPAHADLPLYKYLLLDIIGILSLIFFILLSIACLCCRLVCRCCQRAPPKAKTD